MTPQDAVLQIDIGNTAAKWRLVTAGAVTARGRCRFAVGAGLPRDLLELPAPDAIWVSSVASTELNSDLADACASHWGLTPWFASSEARTGDLVNSYAEPKRLGVDRWLAMLGARARYSGALCVVDVGSAMTIDLVAADGHHEGGYIIPGPALMERALLLDTDRVRFEEEVDYQLVPGRSTAEAVRHGIALAQAGAVATVLARCRQTGPALVCCGGGGATLLGLLEGDGEYVGDLVFEGLEIMARLRGQ